MWHDVVKSCCLMLNQIPKKGCTESPWTMVHGKDIPPNFLKPLGMTAAVLNMNRIKGKKFDVKGQEGLLVGFNVPLLSYRILLRTGGTVESKHVRFLKMPEPTVIDSRQDNNREPEIDESESMIQEECHDEAVDDENVSDHDCDEEIAQMLKSRDPTPESSVQSTRVLRDRSTLKPPVRFGFHHYYEPNTFE
ncbi:hypothetical protein VP01_853g9 [Puccinia sorghi]|uniref:Uncharacterized protein n=1 Tax=Puccinia sorghi TaxID=27349 RepID=A0A0L6UB71_9BASI|nr:hypothetical protein VP01_853g9 [Puccinia sorghi]